MKLASCAHDVPNSDEDSLGTTKVPTRNELAESASLEEILALRGDYGAPYGWRNGKYKHGMKGRPEWKAWVNARRRCTDPNHPDWKNYGGRGIAMCAEWRDSFASLFLLDGGDIFKLSRILGHSSVTITERTYAHLRPDAFQEDYGRVRFQIPNESRVLSIVP